MPVVNLYSDIGGSSWLHIAQVAGVMVSRLSNRVHVHSARAPLCDVLHSADQSSGLTAVSNAFRVMHRVMISSVRFDLGLLYL